MLKKLNTCTVFVLSGLALGHLSPNQLLLCATPAQMQDVVTSGDFTIETTKSAGQSKKLPKKDINFELHNKSDRKIWLYLQNGKKQVSEFLIEPGHYFRTGPLNYKRKTIFIIQDSHINQYTPDTNATIPQPPVTYLVKPDQVSMIALKYGERNTYKLEPQGGMLRGVLGKTPSGLSLKGNITRKILSQE